MQAKLTWSYSTTPTGQAPTQFVIQHRVTGTVNYTTQTTITNLSTVCTGTSCTYVYPAGVLSHNTSYDFRILTDCAEGSTNASNPITIINVLCPVFTPSATSTSISYSFSGATGTSVTGYKVELLLASDNSVVEDDGIIPVATTISGTFNTVLTANTAYIVRVTVKSSGADKVCTFPKSTNATPSCNGVLNLAACVCGVDCATAC